MIDEIWKIKSSLIKNISPHLHQWYHHHSNRRIKTFVKLAIMASGKILSIFASIILLVLYNPLGCQVHRRVSTMSSAMSTTKLSTMSDFISMTLLIIIMLCANTSPSSTPSPKTPSNPIPSTKHSVATVFSLLLLNNYYWWVSSSWITKLLKKYQNQIIH